MTLKAYGVKTEPLVEPVLRHGLLLGVRSRLQDSLRAVVSKENAENGRVTWDEPTYWDGYLCHLRYEGRVDVPMRLRKYVREQYLQGCFRSVEEANDELLETLDGLAIFCTRRIYADVFDCISHKDLGEHSELAFVSVALAPEQMLQGSADEQSSFVLHRDGWYATCTVERLKWDVKVGLGLLVGMIVLNW